MADFFARLIARSQSNTPSLRPQQAARFAPPQIVYAPPPSLTVSPPSNVMANNVMASNVVTDDAIATDAIANDAVDNESTDQRITESTLVESSRPSAFTSTPVASTENIVESNTESNTENTPRQAVHDTVQAALSPLEPIAHQQDTIAIAPPSRSINPTHPISEQSTPLPSSPPLHPSEPTPHRREVATPQPLNAEQESAIPLSPKRSQETMPIDQSLIPNPTVLDSNISEPSASEPSASEPSASEPSAPEPPSRVLANTPLIQPIPTQLSQPFSSQTQQSQTRDLTGADGFKPTESNLTPSPRPRYNQHQSNSALEPQNSDPFVNESQRANSQKTEQSQPNPTLTQTHTPSTVLFQEQPLLPTPGNIVQQPSANEVIASLPVNAQPVSPPIADRRDHTTATTIDITIGRIDIRASPSPAAAKARSQTRQKKANLSLSAYLNKREQS